MVWGILGALDVEIALVKEKMKVTEQQDLFGTTFYRGTIYDKEVVLVRCGVGKINAALCANVVIREYGATHVINVGIAGSLSPQLSVMDVVLSSEVTFHDINHTLYETIYPHVAFFPADQGLVALAEQALRAEATQHGFAYHIGRVATGDDFINDTLQKADIVTRLSPLCVEMEGAAIAHTAYVAGVPFVILRTISDNADDDAEQVYDTFFDTAAHQSANILLHILSLG